MTREVVTWVAPALDGKTEESDVTGGLLGAATGRGWELLGAPDLLRPLAPRLTGNVACVGSAQHAVPELRLDGKLVASPDLPPEHLGEWLLETVSARAAEDGEQALLAPDAAPAAAPLHVLIHAPSCKFCAGLRDLARAAAARGARVAVAEPGDPAVRGLVAAHGIAQVPALLRICQGGAAVVAGPVRAELEALADGASPPPCEKAEL